jgi:hypothetical protein
MTLQFQIGSLWRGVGDPCRYAQRVSYSQRRKLRLISGAFGGLGAQPLRFRLHAPVPGICRCAQQLNPHRLQNSFSSCPQVLQLRMHNESLEDNGGPAGGRVVGSVFIHWEFLRRASAWC